MGNLVFHGPPCIQTPAWTCSGIESEMWSKRGVWVTLWLQKWRGRWRGKAVPWHLNVAQHFPAWNWDWLVGQGAYTTFPSAFLQQWRCIFHFWPVWFKTLQSQFQKCWVLRWENYAPLKEALNNTKHSAKSSSWQIKGDPQNQWPIHSFAPELLGLSIVSNNAPSSKKTALAHLWNANGGNY